ncbi:hypothetical protein OnM2_017089 [Erysiphe neolycopersici]|uniref:Uncharacterized protein n=1 Tax=Erysiphe neolycopersici TaxID=212602 RepID=A0A420I4L8_9PEZI|nr:hypothetical protein OnM2_017089 [Erysiphe neolycopersici]
MKMHICMRCRGVLYGYSETTRYCCACKASTMVPVYMADHNFDYQRNASNPYPAGHAFHDYVKDRSSQSWCSSETNPRNRFTGQTSAKFRRKPITLASQESLETLIWRTFLSLWTLPNLPRSSYIGIRGYLDEKFTQKLRVKGINYSQVMSS